MTEHPTLHNVASPRIAVIGAGPAGLVAADTLRQRGYSRVTVFERHARVGGKVHSVATPAGIAEMGAVLASTECRLVLALADRHGIAHALYPSEQRIVDEHGRRHDAASFLASRYAPHEIAHAIARYAAVLQQFDCTGSDGLTAIHEALSLPFDRFAARYEFEPVAELARGALVGFGYGYYENVPALYFMRLIRWLLQPGGPTGLVPGQFHLFPGGYQTLWEAVAQGLDVRLGAGVTSIERAPAGSPAPLRIAIGQQPEQTFDAAIVTAPLNRVGEFVALNAAEAALFSQVRSNRYVVSTFTATGLATGEFQFLHANERAARIDHANAWAHRHPTLPVYIGWQIVAPDTPLEAVTATLAADVAAQGGQFGELLMREEWDYFPHVSGDALRAGFYECVEALQGQGQVYYAGATLGFETVEHSARHARTLVERCFPPRAAR
ncbi:flavin monoamine oxidase family protein [Burkholderia alba]|uniref:flavin monoamine oxidase family protein n=1 Tax=Burkholderia alba TaxID=2683677 RepID=UPI002B055579|nr:FAD-dependent oxidoreductase [Burkholderia alba]